MRKRLPLHPQPLPDEALSSWIRRLAEAYQLDPDRFIEAVLGLPPPTRCLGVLDDQPPTALLCILSERTGVPLERVRTMSLAGYGGALLGVDAATRDQSSAGLFTDYVCQFGSFAPTAPRRMKPVASLSPIWRPWICTNLLNDHPRSCRQCLASDRIPYTRIHWRAAWMASCSVHGEMLEPFRQGIEDPVWSYERTPARPVATELLALDRLTFAAVTTGTVDLPSGDRVHAGLWLRTLRTLVDEMIRPSQLLRRGAYARVAQLWRAAGRGFHEGLGCLAPFEAMPPERRELALTVASLAASALVTGELSALKENGPAILRPPPRTDLPDLVSPRPPEHRWPREPWWNTWIAEARRDQQAAWRVRSLLNLSGDRRERAEMDAYLAVIGVPIVRSPPQPAPIGATTNT